MPARPAARRCTPCASRPCSACSKRLRWCWRRLATRSRCARTTGRPGERVRGGRGGPAAPAGLGAGVRQHGVDDGRGRRRCYRRGAGLLDRSCRLRPGFGHRVLRCRDRGLAVAGRGRGTRDPRGPPDRRGHPRPGHPRAPGAVRGGLAVAGAALIVMPVLAVAKRRTGQALGNRTLIADSAETAFCAFTSAATLLGVGLNTWLGWWQADPAAALIIAALALREGFEAWEGEEGD